MSALLDRVLDPVRLEQCREGEHASTEHAIARRVPVIYHSTQGRCRGFLSQRDADEYDAGWRSFHPGATPPDTVRTPRNMGFFDAESEHLDALDRGAQP